MVVRLTERQQIILKRASEAGSGRASTYWLSGGQIEGPAAYAACRQLQRRGLLSRDHGGYWPLWRITDEGRFAIAEAPPTPNKEA